MEAHGSANGYILYDRAASKRSTKLRVNSDLLEKARELGVDLATTLEEALVREVHRRQRETWLEENREAMEAYNEHIAKVGVFSAGLRRSREKGLDMRPARLLLLGFIAAAGAAQPFAPSCQSPSYPQPAPSEALGIDAQCGISGSGTGAEGTQDAQKNNFCASGTAQEVTIQDLIALQQQVQQNPAINFGDENTPDRPKGPTTDRAPLAALGEGKLAFLKGYILIARQEGAESVNCGSGVPNQPLYHDIHISVVGSANETEECSGVVVEMSPHHRPDSWNHGNVDKVAKAHALVRVTGQLYFDSSHMPCSGGQPVRTNPKRVSLWEIHPVYEFEVCISDCSGAGQWLPLDLWVQQPESPGT